MADFTVEVRQMTINQKEYIKMQQTKAYLGQIKGNVEFLSSAIELFLQNDPTDENKKEMRHMVMINTKDMEYLVKSLIKIWK